MTPDFHHPRHALGARLGALLLAALFACVPARTGGAAEVDLKSLTSIQKEKKKYGPYVGVFGGATQNQEADVVLNGFQYDSDSDNGAAVFGIEVGYAWRTKHLMEFGLEFEGLFSATELSGLYSETGNMELSPGLGDVATYTTDMSYVAFMVNGTLTLDLRRFRGRLGKVVTSIRPYAGAGVGGAQVWFRNQRTSTFGDLAGTPTAAVVSPFSQDAFVLAYQFFGGVEYMVNDRFGLYTEFRRLTLEKIDEVSDFENDIWLGGFRWRY